MVSNHMALSSVTPQWFELSAIYTVSVTKIRAFLAQPHNANEFRLGRIEVA